MAASKPVLVEFVEDATGQQLGTAEMTAEQLPALFQPGVQLNLAQRPFHIASSVPGTAPQAIAAGKLSLRVRPAPGEQQKQKVTVYTVPTIEAQLPAFDEAQPKQGRRVLAMHEDGWRQVELVAPGAWKNAEKALREVERIQFEERLESGHYRTLHPRRELPQPLAGTAITVEQLMGLLPQPMQRLDGVAFDQHPHVVQDGFALLTPAVVGLYGVAPAGRISVLSLVDARAQGNAEGEVTALVQLMQQHGLKLVDWAYAAVIGPERKRLTRWFAGERG